MADYAWTHCHPVLCDQTKALTEAANIQCTLLIDKVLHIHPHRHTEAVEQTEMKAISFSIAGPLSRAPPAMTCHRDAGAEAILVSFPGTQLFLNL